MVPSSVVPPFLQSLERVGRVALAGCLLAASMGCERDRIESINIDDPAERRIKINIKKAIADFEQQRRLDPKDHRNLWRLGRAYERSEEWGKMATTLADATKVAPAFANYWRGWGQALIELGKAGDRGKYEAARAPLKECIRRDPNIAECHHYLGLADEALGEPRRALQHYQRAIQIKPTSPSFYHSPANLYMAYRRYDEARSILGEGVRLVPKSASYLEDRIEMHRMLAQIALLQGDAAARVGALESAYELESNDAELSLELVRAYTQLVPPRAARAHEVLALFSRRHCTTESKRFKGECREAKRLQAELRSAAPEPDDR